MGKDRPSCPPRTTARLWSCAYRVKRTRALFEGGKKVDSERYRNLSLTQTLSFFNLGFKPFRIDLSGNSTAAIIERRAENVSRAAKSRLNIVDRSSAEAPAFKHQRNVYPEVSKVYRRYLLRALWLQQ